MTWSIFLLETTAVNFNGDKTVCKSSRWFGLFTNRDTSVKQQHQWFPFQCKADADMWLLGM